MRCSGLQSLRLIEHDAGVELYLELMLLLDPVRVLSMSVSLGEEIVLGENQVLTLAPGTD
jgi:hypothetical protein